MASLTKKRKKIKKRKLIMSGRDRKRALRRGTTPKFPIHLDKDAKDIVPQPPGSNEN